jgi:hypothetical protein
MKKELLNGTAALDTRFFRSAAALAACAALLAPSARAQGMRDVYARASAVLPGIAAPAAPAFLPGVKVPAAAPRSAAAGAIRVVYESPKHAKLKPFEALARRTGVFEDNARLLSEQFVLPRDLEIVFKECGEANAWYSSEDHSITMCYELLQESAHLFRPVTSPASAADDVALYSAVWTLYHEMGHALINILDLPAVGREEDAVDQFSTLALIQSGEQEAATAEIAAQEFRLSAAARAKGEKFPFWDVHSVDEQRFYNILCLVYGKDPKAASSQALVDNGELPKERAEGCQEEYGQLDRAWSRLTDPYIRK